MAKQRALLGERAKHAGGRDSRDDARRRRRGFDRRRDGLGHRLQVDRLQARLHLLELVERRRVLGQPALQLRGEGGAVADRRLP